MAHRESISRPNLHISINFSTNFILKANSCNSLFFSYAIVSRRMRQWYARHWMLFVLLRTREESQTYTIYTHGRYAVRRMKYRCISDRTASVQDVMINSVSSGTCHGHDEFLLLRFIQLPRTIASIKMYTVALPKGTRRQLKSVN